MLRGQNDEVLIQKNVNEIVIPFYQIWQEMVNEKTMDIYQYRILTSLSALEELADVLRKTMAGIFTNDANIESCREETLYILNSDMIMEKYYKAIANRLRFGIGKKLKTDAEKTRLYALVKYAVVVVFVAVIGVAFLGKESTCEYSRAVTPPIRQTGNRLSGRAGTA